MKNSFGKALLVLVGTFCLLFGTAYLHFGTEWGWNHNLFLQILIISIIFSVLLGWWMNRQQRIAVGAILLGFFLFILGTSGGGAGCTDGVYDSSATYRITYDVLANALHFGETVDGQNYRCFTEPIRLLVVIGYVVASGGFLSLQRTSYNN